MNHWQCGTITNTALLVNSHVIRLELIIVRNEVIESYGVRPSLSRSNVNIASYVELKVMFLLITIKGSAGSFKSKEHMI